jgi:hypothetical protein
MEVLDTNFHNEFRAPTTMGEILYNAAAEIPTSSSEGSADEASPSQKKRKRDE